MVKLLFLGALALCMGAIPPHAGEVADSASSGVLVLSGTDWRIHDDSDGKGAERRLFAADVSSPEWIPATVPCNIQADLEAARLLKPLWYGAGDPRLPDVARKDWWYRKEFTRSVRVVMSTIDAAQDMECEDLRRLYVNCAYWAMGVESAIPQKADVRYVGGDWKASRFGGGKFVKGLMPKDFAITKQE